MLALTARSKVAIVVARAWGGGPLLVCTVLALTAWSLVPETPVPVPARDGVSSVLWPLVPALVAVAVPQSLATLRRDLERTAALARAALNGRVLGLTLGASVVAAVGGLRHDVLVVARNSALLVGLAVAAATWLRPSLGWLVPAVVPMAMWLFGTDASTHEVQGWALLLLPRSATAAAWVSSTALILASAAYLRVGGRGNRCAD